MTNQENADRFHSRKNPRLKRYDYATPNYYFVTICTWDKTCMFGEAGRLNFIGRIAEEGLLKIPQHFSCVELDKYVVMPNHIHAILILREGADNLSVIIGQYKSYVTRKVREQLPDQKVWQTSFHDHVIRDQNSYEKIWLYIESNPANWQKDCFFQSNQPRENIYLVGGAVA